MPKKTRKRTSELPVQDPILGKLCLSATLDGKDEYKALVTLSGRRVTIDLYTDEAGDLKPCIVRARSIVEHYATIEKRIHRYIERVVLPVYNETMRPNKKPVALEQILRQLKLRFVTTHPDPKATFWFDAGKLFLGHGLQLCMGDRGKFVDFDLPG